MIPRLRSLSLTFLLALPAAPAQAAVTLQTGDVTVELIEPRSWSMLRFEKAGRFICDSLASAQGTVIFIENFGAAGSSHENEILLDVVLLVDGQQQNFVDGTAYTGNTIVFTRTTELGGAFLLTCLIGEASSY